MTIPIVIDGFALFTFLLTGNQIMIAFWKAPPTLTQVSQKNFEESPKRERSSANMNVY